MFVKVAHLRKDLHDGLVIPLGLIDLGVVKKFLKDWIYNSLAYFGANAYKFIPPLLKVL